MSVADKITEKESKIIWSQGKIRAVAKSIPNIRNRALFILEYLTGGRVGEIVCRVQKSDFEKIILNGVSFLQINNLHTEKNRKRPVRELIFPIEKEKMLIDMLYEYLDSVNDDDILFNFTRQRAWQIIHPIILKNKPIALQKTLNGNHYLRHCRNTHLALIYDFNEYELQEWNGWSDIRPARVYVHVKKKDIARKFMGG